MTLLWHTCVQDLASQAMEVAKGTKGLEEVVDSIREHEMQILNSLVDGSALGQHMEVGREPVAAAAAAAAWSEQSAACVSWSAPDNLRASCCVCTLSLLQDFYLATLKQAVLAANPALAGQVQQAMEEVAASSAPAAAADVPSETTG